MKTIIPDVIRRYCRDYKHRIELLRSKSGQYNVVKYGTNYGMACVAVDLLDKSSIIWSVGVGRDVSFDKRLLASTGAEVHLFDPSPRSVDWIMEHQLYEQFKVHQWGIASESGMKRFSLPSDENHVSGSLTADLGGEDVCLPFKTLDHTAKDLGHDTVDFLKLDIEGEEYRLLDNYAHNGSCVEIRQMWVEFHPDRAPNSRKNVQEIAETMSGRGYSVEARVGGSILLVQRE